jgi:hypothetical protein
MGEMLVVVDSYSKTIQDTQLLIHRAQWQLKQMQEDNSRQIELSEQMTILCEKFLKE